jgi:hypothetical protein
VVSEFPIRPYADAETGRSSGWRGADTSKERAHTADSDGTTLRRQRLVLASLEAAGEAGLTALEMRVLWEETNPNKVSPACTVLHKEGLIVRLRERRGNHHVYVLPQHVGDRAEEPFVREESPKPRPMHNHRDRFLRPPGECDGCQSFWDADWPLQGP